MVDRVLKGIAQFIHLLIELDKKINATLMFAINEAAVSSRSV